MIITIKRYEIKRESLSVDFMKIIFNTKNKIYRELHKSNDSRLSSVIKCITILIYV